MVGIRKAADTEIAGLDPEALPAALKQGIAPAMKADITGPFWGGKRSEKDSEEQRKLCGCKPEKEVSKAMRRRIDMRDSIADALAVDSDVVFRGDETWAQLEGIIGTAAAAFRLSLDLSANMRYEVSKRQAG